MKHPLLPFLLVFVASAASSSTVPSSSASFVVSSGLQNLGNTCYLNAQLQCAFHIPLVRSLVTSALAPATDDSTASTDSAALQAVRRLFLDMEQSVDRPVAPRHLCTTLGIPVLQQQDSQEFWKLLLPALQLPVLTDLYQGAYEDYIVALDGSGREKRREEAFLDLSLDVSTPSVQTSLAQLFGEPELLSCAEGNGWRPEKGADKVDAHKGTLLRSQGLPPILQLHLKRFHFDWMTETTSKINDPLAFPEVLDLSTICEDTKHDDDDDDKLENENVVYDLQAVVIHAGTYGAGHYYAYVRPNVQSDVWYRFNDNVVEEVDLKDVLCDGYGGRLQIDSPSEKKGGFLAKVLRFFQPLQGSSYGYGGSTSNAYVLQYVRRSDIPFLYLCEEE
jgi:ubiquitin carboxyl-terminal hydrolase 7